MTEQIDFYILDQASESDRLLFSCKIAGKAMAQGMKIYFQTETDAQAAEMDQLLWSCSPTSFMPHSIWASGRSIESSTPILVGTEDPPAGWGELLISLTEEVPATAGRFRRVADLIAGDETQKQKGRARYKQYREQGIEPVAHKIGA